MSLKICDKMNKPSGRMNMDCMLENTKQCRQQYRKLKFVNSLIFLFFPSLSACIIKFLRRRRNNLKKSPIQTSLFRQFSFLSTLESDQKRLLVVDK